MAGRARSLSIIPIALWAILAAVALLAGRVAWARPLPEPQAIQARPSLAVPAIVAATAGQPVTVPLT
ncbi:MAG: hypothetical protein KA170_09920, partial [Candidatus Promineofilum sp.]|nr:hypothetical protein [Promineifilum sp.]